MTQLQYTHQTATQNGVPEEPHRLSYYVKDAASIFLRTGGVIITMYDMA